MTRTVIYKKDNLQLVGTVVENMTPYQEIELNVIPNFGGSINDYGFIATDLDLFHLENINGENVIVDDSQQQRLLDVLKPTKKEVEQAEFELKTINVLLEVGLV